MPSRDQTLQLFLDLYQAPAYLEIGVQRGVTFHQIKAGRKVAVDPNFLFGRDEREASSEYHDLTSDEYFATLSRTSPKFNVIFLDGLHTFEQTLRDLLTAIDYLVPDGVIVIDDVIPSSYHASLPNTAEFARVWEVAGGSVNWMGDVYKLLFFIETYLPAFAYATTKDNHGQIVLWRGKREEGYFKDRKLDEICRFEYKDVIILEKEFNKKDTIEIVETIKKDLPSSR